jgi:predicted porin
MENYMKTKLSLAVAAALVASASSANAGIMIPAGDWTLDIGGIVNAYYTSTRHSGANVGLGGTNSTGDSTESNITTGLLPNYLSVSGKTRQNDLDVGFTISIQPGASTTHSGIQGAGANGGGNQENRQAFLTFGDKSWGSIKIGKDLGIYASDAILNDMTLLGVGSGAGLLAGNTTTLGRIGTGFMYADWKAQIAYSSPNWNGFSFTAGVTQAWNATTAVGGASSTGRGGSSPAFEGKASYEWAGDFGGKVWVSGLSQKVEGIGSSPAVVAHRVFNTSTALPATSTVAASAAVAGTSDTASAWDLGGTVNVAGFGLTAYYGQGEGTGTTIQFRDGYDATGNARDSDDWYVQGTFTIPGAGTKLGVSYGESTLDGNTVDTFTEYSNRMWTVGAYHPITKHLNLVAEYSDVKGELKNNATTNPTGASAEGKSKTFSLGAILFF